MRGKLHEGDLTRECFYRSTVNVSMPATCNLSHLPRRKEVADLAGAAKCIKEGLGFFTLSVINHEHTHLSNYYNISCCAESALLYTMKFISLALALALAATGSAQVVRGPNGNCGFPGGPTCESLGRPQRGELEQFTDPAESPASGCCLLPARCGNGDGGERCERV